ncbi:hypothetical protein I2485_02625 [Nesterenkonia sp. E16_7]|uniref:N-acetylmuramoyl-L-alanine amidase n=1 Tax=unclassified Nesterenkonia TaxID=2629769 RepID=UPI001A9371C1|nr:MULTISPECIES: N-acetylmuramoyl-L-alanine amidase [unclassified Nesterenkonia]MBO0594095.1 hypothetical protein [Nesterenkonia sp. E16_10]MBO0597541.1 hypothetical protein [Nesterenkonia sp. E16_7]
MRPRWPGFPWWHDRDDVNREAIAFSFDANSSKYPVTAAQLESAAKVGKAMTEDWGGNLVHMMHGDWNPTDRSDPTRVPGGWSALRAAIKRGSWSAARPAATKPAPVKPAASKPAAKSSKPWPSGRRPWPDAYLSRAGKRNKHQDKALHDLLGRVGYTGTFAQRLQKWCKKDGTYRGLITHISVVGPSSTRAWQTSLSRRTNPKTGRRFYTGRIDGKRGPQTANATVDWLNWQADIIHGKG